MCTSAGTPFRKDCPKVCTFIPILTIIPLFVTAHFPPCLWVNSTYAFRCGRMTCFMDLFFLGVPPPLLITTIMCCSTRQPSLRCAQNENGHVWWKNVYSCSEQTHREGRDTIIVQMVIPRHTFRQSLLEGVHTVALVCTAEKWWKYLCEEWKKQAWGRSSNSAFPFHLRTPG